MGALDVAALQRYLTFLWCPGEGTPLRSVRKLRPGEAMIVRSGRIERRWNWYHLPAFRREGKPALDQTAAIEGTREHLRNAVRRQMIADVPVGAFLSGGLDSSAIVALAREQNPAIRCFTIEASGGQEAGATDDLPYARRVAEHLGVPLDVVRIDAGRMAGDLERMVAQLDEPLADPAPLNVLYISQLAREHGIKVLLSGAGGDDLFTGYRRHRALMAERWWSWLPCPMRQGLAKATGALDQRSAFARRLAKLFSGAGLDGDARLVNYFRWANRADLEPLYSAEFRAALSETRAEAPMLEFLRDLPPETSRLERMLALEQRFFLADHNLLYTDKMSMAAGVEVRVPFLDLDLVEFASRIPERFKQRGMAKFLINTLSP
ncbi:MAG: asparagine synthase, partial [Chloroflexia bacterium]|nr:asparagine synthase [Chloroflexia bacterium]